MIYLQTNFAYKQADKLDSEFCLIANLNANVESILSHYSSVTILQRVLMLKLVYLIFYY